MRRELGILAMTASILACGGGLAPDEDDVTMRPDGIGARDDADTTRGDPAPSGAPRDAAVPPGTSSPIDSVVSVSNTLLGADGILTTYAQLVVLFKDGTGCYDVDVLKLGVNLASQRASKPSDWFKWRRGADGTIQRYDVKSGSWKSLGAEATYPPLARGSSLSGTYIHVGVGGSLIFGGKVVALQFSGATFSVVVGGKTLRGTYRIDGYSLMLTDASGRSEAHSIVRAGGGFVWIDGAEYRPR